MIVALPKSDCGALLPKLRVKPVPTASGIVVVAGMSKLHRWPHIATTGNICVYCPGGPDSDFERSTQSYTGYEPTSMRAIWAGMAFSSSLTHFIEHLIGNSSFMLFMIRFEV